jgi:hypothetical protein
MKLQEKVQSLFATIEEANDKKMANIVDKTFWNWAMRQPSQARS